MNFKLRSLVAATLTGSVMMGFGVQAKADATFDLVQALVQKGVLTEEEALPLLKGRENDIQTADKKVKKATRLTVSDIVENATVYGDIRARYEMRKGEDTSNNSEDRDRGRYKLTFGVKTEANDFYSDLAFAMGPGGRSDNSTFGNGNSTAANQNGSNNKEILFVKRAMLGWKATDWLALEAGRIANPLYTTSMVWDADLTMEGLAEKLNYKFGDVEVFGNLVQSQYLGDYQNFNSTAGTVDRITNNLLAFQGGANFKITDDVSAKAAVTYTKYTNDKATGARTFVPGLGTTIGAGSLGTAIQATNDLRILDVPMEVNYQTSGNLGFKLFADYAVNLDGSDRYHSAIAAATAGTARNTITAAGNDDNAWLVGLGIESKKDKKAKKDDWSAKLWYQDVGVYALDPNTVDSDFMDSRVNMQGVVFKGEYLLRDNVFLNFAAGHATRKNDKLAAVGTGNDIKLNLDKYDLYQFDITYKF